LSNVKTQFIDITQITSLHNSHG